MKHRAIIVDDEPLARERIRQLLASEADVEVVAECRDGHEAVAAVRELDPDLAFLDIQMPEMDGFDVLAELAGNRLPVIVFVTAYDQYALRAFEVHAIDYLLKPFDARRFRDALGRAREQVAARGAAAINQRMAGLLDDLQARRRYLQRFVVRTAGRILFVSAREVEAIEADGNYMRLYGDRDAYLIRDTMEGLAAKLDPQRFLRVHRSWIVNVDHIQELQSWFQGGWVVVLRRGRRIHVGRRYHEALSGLLEPSV